MCLPGVAWGTSGAVAGNTAAALTHHVMNFLSLGIRQVDNYRYYIYIYIFKYNIYRL